MGYSCSLKANLSKQFMMELLQNGDATGPSNKWARDNHEYFYEIGNEQFDGAITAIVWKGPINATLVKPCGGIRIEGDGRITRWPTTTKAEQMMRHEYETTYKNGKFIVASV